MTNQEFMTWIENFLVDVQWTPAIRKKVLYMVNSLDTRTQYIEKPETIIKREIIYVTKGEETKSRPDLDEIAIDICQRHKITIKDLTSKSRKTNLVTARVDFCKLGRIVYGYTFTELGLFLHRDHTTMIHYLTTRKDPVPNFSTFAYGGQRDTVRVESHTGGISEEGEVRTDIGGIVRAIDAPEVQRPIQRGDEADESFTEKLTLNAM